MGALTGCLAGEEFAVCIVPSSSEPTRRRPCSWRRPPTSQSTVRMCLTYSMARSWGIGSVQLFGDHAVEATARYRRPPSPKSSEPGDRCTRVSDPKTRNKPSNPRRRFKRRDRPSIPQVLLPNTQEPESRMARFTDQL
jgi:hypothetical protein